MSEELLGTLWQWGEEEEEVERKKKLKPKLKPFRWEDVKFPYDGIPWKKIFKELCAGHKK